MISYAGCGCAGGLETTIQGEEIIEKDWNGSNPVSLGRRTQKIYEDILGRAWKTEVLNWNSSVYLTTETAYDGRDQALTVTQTEASTSVSQVTSMTYDGHGRLKTLHSPRQDANKSTVYNYNPDDSISDVTDARGAKMRYQYNNRGLVDTIDSILPEPSEIPAAPAVGFEYDTVGNRTLMTDGLGTVNYEYDSLSRLTAETRAFTDNLANAPAGGVYRLEYTYEIGGRLRSYKDPYGQQFYFANDKAGRGLSVTGNTAFAGVTGYVSSAKYRAWGGLKELHTGDGMRSETDYNNRLRPYSFKLKRPDNSLVMDKTYDYYADESLRRVDDLLQNKFDRLNKYDHIGNIRESKAGTLARGEISSHYEDRPYTQLYSFDTFGRFRGRSGSYWNTTYTYSYTYVNVRVTAYTTTGASNPSLVWQYDADGREIVSYTDFFRRGDQVYDAAGNLTKVIDYALTGNTPISEVQRYYDGDGREGKRTSRVFNTSTNTWEERPARYFVVSSVFDGETVSKTDETGRKLETNVFAGRRMVARQLVYYGTLTGDLYQVEWKNQDNFGLSDLRTRKRHDSDTVTGDSFAPLELDAAGTELLSLLPEGGGIDPDLPMEQNQGDVWQTANDPNYYNRGLGGAASPACAVGSFLIDCSRVRFADGIGNGVFGSLERAQRESARQIGARFRVRELVAASPSGPPVLRSGGSRPGSQRISSDGESILIGYEWWIEPIFNDSWSTIALIIHAGSGDPDALLRATSLVDRRVRFLTGVGGQRFEEEDNIKNIRRMLIWMAYDQDCAKAFENAGLKTPYELISSRGLTLAGGGALLDPSNNRKLGITNDERTKLRRKLDSLGNQAFTLTSPDTTVIFFKNEAFYGESYFQGTYSLEEVVVHEMIHAAGVGQHTSRFGRHDLFGYAHYAEILKNCRFDK